MSNDTHMTKDHEQALKTVAKGAGIGFIGLIIGKIFAYLIRVFIARTLGPSDFGLISIGLAILSIFTTFSLLGLNQGLTRMISYYKGKNNFKKIKGAIFSSFKIVFSLSIFFSLVLFLIADKISIIFFSEPKLINIIKIFSFALPFSVLMNLSSSSFLGFKMVKYKVYIKDIFKNISTFLLIIIFFYFSFNLLRLSLAFLLGYIISAFVGLYYLKTKIYPHLKKISKTPVWKELIGFSYTLFLSGTVALVMGYTDVLMLGYFDTISNVGIYNAALNTCILITFVLTSFAFIFLPLITELFSKNKKKQIRKIYTTSTRWIFSIVFPIFLIFILFPDNILRILFGPDFVSGSLALVILSFGFLTHVSVGLSIETITAIGKPKINLYLNSLAAVSNFFLNLILIPIYGMVGAAIAMTSGLMLKSIFSLLYLNKKIGVQPYTRDYLKPFFSAILSSLIFYIIIKNFLSINFFTLIIGFVFFLFLYSYFLLISKGLTRDDIIILKSIENKTGLKIKWLRNIIKKFI